MSDIIKSRRLVLKAGTAIALGAAVPMRAHANPLLFAIIPSVIAGVFSLLSAQIQTRDRRSRELDQALIRKANEDSMRMQAERAAFETRMMRKEYEDRQRRDRNAFIASWLKLGIEANLVDYKVGFETIKNRFLTAPISSSMGMNGVNLGIEDGLVRLDGGGRDAIMHGGEIKVARDYLAMTGRMPIPLDVPYTPTNRQKEAILDQLVPRLAIGKDEIEHSYRLLATRPYSDGGKRTAYWLSSIVNNELYESNRPQSVGFIETSA